MGKRKLNKLQWSAIFLTLGLSFQSVAESLKDSDCRIQVRRKFTRKWSEFSGSFKKDTQVKYLNKPGTSLDSPVIFVVLFEPGIPYKMFEFKAPKSCFVATSHSSDLNLEEDSSRAENNNSSSTSGGWKKRFILKALYYQAPAYFKVTGSEALFQYTTTYYGLGAGLSHELEWSKHRIGLNWDLLFARGKAQGAPVSSPVASLSANSLGLNLEPYYMHMMGKSFGAGLGINWIGNYNLWPSSAYGGMTEKTFSNTYLSFKLDALFKKSKLGFDFGFGAPLFKWLTAMRFEF